MMNFMDLTSCRLCPRNCGVNRRAGELGFCGLPETIRAARNRMLRKGAAAEITEGISEG